MRVVVLQIQPVWLNISMLKLTLVLPPMLSFTLKPKAIAPVPPLKVSAPAPPIMVSALVPPTKLLIVVFDKILPSFKVRALVD
jgi:hypothetical protein